MVDVVLTGASRGIGRALALALAGPETRLHLVARDAAALAEVARDVCARGGAARAWPGDLGTVARARSVGEDLARAIGGRATLIHCAGLWPVKRSLNADGLEASFVVNHLGPLALQAPLLAAKRLARIMVVSAGLIALGRFRPTETPAGLDFSALRTYATTKLCFAIAMREVAAAEPAVDVVVLHPGVVRTELGAASGALGWLLRQVKRRWEDPAVTAARLARILARPRWSQPGTASWLVLEEGRPWPKTATDERTAADLRAVTQAALRCGSASPTQRA